MASVVNCINQSVDERIATIEEPARYFYPKAKALLDQKQVAIDTPDYAHGLDLALESGARVVALGEMAEPRTFSIALEAASTKLVFCRISAASPADAVRAVVERYSPAERPSILAGLAKNLVGMIFVKSLPRTQPEGGEILAAAAVHCDARFRAALADPDWDSSVTKALIEDKESHETLRESVCSLYEKHLVDKHTLEVTIGSVEKCRW
jgi:twitching motility protein PilT